MAKDIEEILEDELENWLEDSDDEEWDEDETNEIPEEEIDIDPDDIEEDEIEEQPQEPSKTDNILPPLYYPKRPCWIDIKQGDCLVSIAAFYHLSPEFILQQNENKEIAQDNSRAHNQLLVGDRVYVPAPQNEYVPVSIGERNVFKLTPTATTTVRVRFLCGGKARAGLACQLKVENTCLSGNTDENGAVQFTIPALQRNCQLLLDDIVNEEKITEVYRLMLGYLDPVSNKSGVKARLIHLGHFIVNQDENDDDQLTTAIKRFQVSIQENTSGIMSKANEDRLKEVHSS